MSAGASLRIGRRNLLLSNLDRVLYPRTGFTKRDVVSYYLRVGSTMVSHLRSRAVTFKRYPNGVEGQFFYEKNCPSFHPTWIKTAPTSSDRTGGSVDYCLLNDTPSLVWAANLAALELHVGLARVGAPRRPTSVVFDLDPGPGTDLRTCARVAVLLHRILGELRLEAFPKTSGRKGFHVYVPVNGRATFDETKRFARAVAELMQRMRPDLVVSSMNKALRRGKVYVDWAQNDAHKTTVCAYSLRATERPSVSTPIEWDEVTRAAASRRANVLAFGPEDVLERIREKGDLFAGVAKLKQRLPSLH